MILILLAINLIQLHKTYPVKLSSKGERAIKKGHPWIFEDSILKIDQEIQSGNVCIIFSKKENKFLALGLYDADSPIRIKVLLHGEKNQFNEQFIFERLSQAKKLRLSLLEQTNAYRWIHGENDQLPGLIIDQYANVIVVKLYSAIWFPYLEWLINSIVKLEEPRAIVLRTARRISMKNKLKDGTVLYGELSEPIIAFEEYGVKFSANVIRGHKTGYFLDHRLNRVEVGRLAKGKSVLDIFSYAGGFSIHALAGGARKVVSIDISKAALALAEKNASLNGDYDHYETRVGDGFELMKEALEKQEKYEIVVVDPPSFAKAQRDVEKALNAYTRLAKLAINLVAENGVLIMASCSSRVGSEQFFNLIENEFWNSVRSFSIIKKTYHDIDHPIGFTEGAYLKCGYYRIH